MTIKVMSREEALVKLLRIEPMTRDSIFYVCGWPIPEAEKILAKLVDEKRVRLVTGRQVRQYVATG